jgi:hypothetical protein
LTPSQLASVTAGVAPSPPTSPGEGLRRAVDAVVAELAAIERRNANGHTNGDADATGTLNGGKSSSYMHL